MKARRFPGVRCSTENTECKSLLCLITMPGRNCVAGIAIPVTPYLFWGSRFARTSSRSFVGARLEGQTLDFTCPALRLGNDQITIARQRQPNRSFLTEKRRIKPVGGQVLSATIKLPN